MLPVQKALVAAMNIQGVEITNRVVLSPLVLVDMIMGNITYCEPPTPILRSPDCLTCSLPSRSAHSLSLRLVPGDDPRVKALNPNVALPHVTFSVVVRTDSIGQNLVRFNLFSTQSLSVPRVWMIWQIVATAFAKWNPEWVAKYGVSSRWNWPDR